MPIFYSGMSGSVTFATTIVGAKSWEMTIETDAAGSSNWDTSDWENTYTGISRWSGTITTDLDKFTTPVPTDTSGAAVLYTGSGQSWAGTIIITGVRNAVSKGADVVEIIYSFRGSGTLTAMESGFTHTGTHETSYPRTVTASADLPHTGTATEEDALPIPRTVTEVVG